MSEEKNHVTDNIPILGKILKEKRGEKERKEKWDKKYDECLNMKQKYRNISDPRNRLGTAAKNIILKEVQSTNMNSIFPHENLGNHLGTLINENLGISYSIPYESDWNILTDIKIDEFQNGFILSIDYDDRRFKESSKIDQFYFYWKEIGKNTIVLSHYDTPNGWDGSYGCSWTGWGTEKLPSERYRRTLVDIVEQGENISPKEKCRGLINNCMNHIYDYMVHQRKTMEMEAEIMLEDRMFCTTSDEKGKAKEIAYWEKELEKYRKTTIKKIQI